MQAPNAGPQPWEQKAPRGREGDRISGHAGGVRMGAAGSGGGPSQQSGVAFLDNEISPPWVLLEPASSQINLNGPFVPRVKGLRDVMGLLLTHPSPALPLPRA